MTELIEGWNLVNSGGYTNSFANLAGTANENEIKLIYAYENGKYVKVGKEDNLTQGYSYWVLCENNITLSVDLGNYGKNIFQIYKGWNLIASPRNTPITLNDIFEANIDTVSVMVKRESNNYINVDLNEELEPGVGYWVLVSREFKIEMSWFIRHEEIIGNTGGNNYGNKILAAENRFYSIAKSDFDIPSNNSLKRLTQLKVVYTDSMVDDTKSLLKSFNDGQYEPDVINYATSKKNEEEFATLSIGSNNKEYLDIWKFERGGGFSIYGSLNKEIPDLNVSSSNNSKIAFGGRFRVLIHKTPDDPNLFLFYKIPGLDGFQAPITITLESLLENGLIVESLLLTPDGNTFAVSSRSKINVYDITNITSRRQVGPSIDVNATTSMNMALSDDGRTIAFTKDKSEVKVFRYNNAVSITDQAWVELGNNLSHAGDSIDIDDNGTTVVSGSPDEDCIYIDRWNGTEWITSKITGDGIGLGYKFGTSVSINNNLISVGSPEFSQIGKIIILENKGVVKDDTEFPDRFQLNFKAANIQVGGQIGVTTEWGLLRKNLIYKAAKQWSDLISSMPGGNNNRKITINCYLSEFPNACTTNANGQTSCIAGAAGPSQWSPFSPLFSNDYFNYYTITGNLYLNINIGLSGFINVAGHEIGHVLGIGTFWSNTDYNFHKSELKTAFLEDDNEPNTARQYYKGVNALSVYRHYNSNNISLRKNGIDTNYVNTEFSDAPNFIGIPIEQDGGEGTSGGHIEEGSDLNNDKDTFLQNDIRYCSFKNEIMTGFTTGGDIISAITIGLIADLGYGVNWKKSQPYTLSSINNSNLQKSQEKNIKLTCMCNHKNLQNIAH